MILVTLSLVVPAALDFIYISIFCLIDNTIFAFFIHRLYLFFLKVSTCWKKSIVDFVYGYIRPGYSCQHVSSKDTINLKHRLIVIF